MNDVLDKIVEQLAKPTPEVVPQAMWATVTQASPLRIRFDGEAAALDITPVNLTGALIVGDRVKAQLVNKQLHVVARLNGVDLSGKQNTPTLINGMDMNNVTQSGWYYGYLVTNTGAVYGAISAFEVIYYSADWIVQKQYVMGADTWDNTWVRSRYSGTTWAPWVKTNTPPSTYSTTAAMNTAITTGVAAPKARITKTTAGPTVSATGTFYQVTAFTSTPYDTNSITVASTGVVTIPSAGVYHIEFFLPWSSYGTAYSRQLVIAKGLTAASIVASKNTTNLGVWYETVTYEDYCAAGDKFTFWINSATTGSGAVASTALIPPTSVSVRKVL